MFGLNLLLVRSFRMSWMMRMFFVTLSSLNILSVNCAPTCLEGQFYDTDSGMCDYCSVVCDNAKITGTLLKCQRNCMDYLVSAKRSTVATTTTSPTVNQEYKRAPSTETTPTPHNVQKTQAVGIAVVSGVVIVIVVVIVVVVVKMRHKVLSRCRHTPEGNENVKYSIEESSTSDVTTEDGSDDSLMSSASDATT